MADKPNADREAAEKIEHRPTCAARDPQTERPCDCSEVQRLRDLVRYCRHQLHEEGLISDEEFTDLLSNTPGAVARLEGYDKAIATAKQDIARKMIAALAVRFRDVVPNDRFETVNRQFNQTLSELIPMLKIVAKDNGVEVD